MGHGHGSYTMRTNNSDGGIKPRKAKKMGPDSVFAVPNYPKKPTIKFVKRASLWCKTTYENPYRGHGGRTMLRQKQEWSKDKPDA